MTKLMYAVVVFYCTTPTECWTSRPFPNEFFDSEAACAGTLEGRAREVLLPHFRKNHTDISLRCDAYNVTRPAATK